MSPVPPSTEPVLSQVPPADRSALQDSMGLAVEQVLTLPGMTGTVIVAGATGERRVVRHVVVDDPADPLSGAGPDVLIVLAGPLPLADPVHYRALVERLHRGGSAALAYRTGDRSSSGDVVTGLPAELLAEADRRGFPVFALPATARLDEVVAEVLGAIINRQTQALSLANRMHNQFIDVALSGGGLAEVTGQVSTFLDGAAVLGLGRTTTWRRSATGCGCSTPPPTTPSAT